MQRNQSQARDYEPLFTPEEVAQVFKVSDDVVRQMIRKGQLVAIKFGRQYRIPKSVVDQLFQYPRPAIPEEIIFNAYQLGLISTGKVGELLGVGYYEGIERLKKRGIQLRLGPQTLDELKEEVRNARKLFPPG